MNKLRFFLNMKHVVRNQVFETNSSSVHSIVVKETNDYKIELERSQTNPYAVVACCMDYSDVGHDETYVIATQQDKFNYLMSWLACKYEYTYYDDLKSSWEYSYVLNALRSVDNKIDDIIVIDSNKAKFDHQTAPYNSSDCVVDLYSERAIKDFIFNDSIMLECYFD